MWRRGVIGLGALLTLAALATAVLPFGVGSDWDHAPNGERLPGSEFAKRCSAPALQTFAPPKESKPSFQPLKTALQNPQPECKDVGRSRFAFATAAALGAVLALMSGFGSQRQSLRPKSVSHATQT